jgi:hypothetical protein
VLGPKFGRLTLQAGVALDGIGWVLLVLALRGQATIDWLDLAPGLLVAGIGTGLIVAPMFDIILAAVTDAETGSASGVLNASQQLATSIGVAVLGTVFFDGIGHGNFHHALTLALVIQVGAMIGLLVLSPLLPRFAREPIAE